MTVMEDESKKTEPQSQITTSGRLVRLFVGGLPLGLIVMGALSFVIWNYKKQEKPPVVLEFAQLLQKEVGAEEFDRYVRIMTEEIGGSSIRDEEKREAIAGFVESSMGLENMGYESRRKKSPDGGLAVYVELPGSSFVGADEVLLVVTRGDNADKDKVAASRVAALMSVAHALTGAESTKLIRLAVVMGDGMSLVAPEAKWVIDLSDDAILQVEDGSDMVKKMRDVQASVEEVAEVKRKG